MFGFLDQNSGDRDSQKSREILSLLGRYGMLQTSSALLEEARSLIFASVAARATQSASGEAFSHLQSVDIDVITANKVSEFGPMIEKSSQAVGSMMNNSVIRLSSMIIELAMLQRRLRKKKNGADMNWISALTLASYFAYTLLYSERRVIYRLANSRCQTILRGNSQESFANAETVRLLMTEDEEINRHRRIHDSVTLTKCKVGKSLAKLNAGQKLITTLGSSVAMWIRARQVLMGKAKPGDVVSIQQTYQQVCRPLHYLGTMYREFKVDYKDIKNIVGLLNTSKTIRNSPGDRDLLINKGSIQIENVSLTYPNGKQALHKIALSIPGGSSVGIVGPSGSGKSTLIKLIARLYDPADGFISICNQNIKHVTLESLRKSVGIVAQDTILFDDTLGYNLLYGVDRQNLGQDEVYHAIKAAKLDNFLLNLKDGLDTQVGVRGSKLSGGERQRVAIARNILRKPKITILDEATSCLDAHTEKHVITALRVRSFMSTQFSLPENPTQKYSHHCRSQTYQRSKL